MVDLRPEKSAESSVLDERGLRRGIEAAEEQGRAVAAGLAVAAFLGCGGRLRDTFLEVQLCFFNGAPTNSLKHLARSESKSLGM